MVKRIILCAIIALFSVEAGAQSARSNQLFDEGVELYRQGKYREAISVFSRVDLLDKLDFPEGNPRREYAALWMASCYYKLGDEAKARELDSLTYVFPPVDRRLTVQSDSLSVLAQEYINVGDYESALPLVRQCVALEKEALGANSIWYANSLGMYANCLLYAGHDLEEVMQATAEPLAIYTNYNMYSGMANMYYLIGDVYYNMSDYEKAFVGIHGRVQESAWQSFRRLADGAGGGRVFCPISRCREGVLCLWQNHQYCSHCICIYG